MTSPAPNAGFGCYEVGEELSRLRLDLWQANADLLVHAGVPRAQVHVAGLCTTTHVDVLESFRVDGDRAGRMAAIIVAP